MTEVTRVPLQPIAKGSLTKLWLGVIVAALIGAGIAWAAVPPSISVETVQEGTGETPNIGDMVFVKYTGKLADGTVFEESQSPPIPPGIFPEGTPFPIEEGATVAGFFEGLQKMRKGGRYVLHIPSNKGYGDSVPPGSPIPPGADLIFEIEVIDFMGRADFDTRLQALQQMMQMQQQGEEGGAGGPAGAPPQAQPGN
ncbi:FKBP-type peptidyl-prolyl cis-trans isomerase [Pontixanthobacter aquaemixtae]|uniref:Peptidyl-prolyl cis-trans isomerase n=1 Tax=Pontixanthobacter aquaemixtae TaxID=1958940 RepID=A0A844ZNP3_9SPHN|nr:FKBP-type peptidyl-prolyl cis-trans isomerase [Pontixanthobacter aquaemixtae]MXO89465.1 peptidylprolyl isomerase [Pontixanthobacter aquaemixtae]